MRDFIRQVIAYATRDHAAFEPPSRSETDLRAALTTLAERWEQAAKSLAADLPTELFVEQDTGHQWAATVAHNHRIAAQDLREVLRTGRIPNGWMTAAEEEQYGTPEATS
jgi:hypothetical protein